MILRILRENNFDFSKLPADIRTAVDFLDSQTEGTFKSDNEKINMLDKTVFDSIRNVFPKNLAVVETNNLIETREAQDINDSFNTVMPEDYERLAKKKILPDENFNEDESKYPRDTKVSLEEKMAILYGDEMAIMADGGRVPAKPAYLMTLEEYQSEVTPILKEYDKFVRKNDEYFAKVAYYGIFVYTFPEALSDFKAGKIRGEHFRRNEYNKGLSDDKAVRKDWSYRKTHQFNENFKPAETPKGLTEEKNKYIEKLSKYFSDEEIDRLIDKDERKSNRRTIRRAIQNDIYGKLLKSGKVKLAELEKIALSVGVKLPNKVLDDNTLRARQNKIMYDKIYASMPKINLKVLSKLVDDVKEGFKPLEKAIYKIQTESYERRVKELIKEGEANTNLLELTMSFYGDVFNYEKRDKRIHKFIKDGKPEQSEQLWIVGLSLKDGWKEVVSRYVLSYIEELRIDFLFAIIRNFEKITLPIESIKQVSLEVGMKGFEGSYKFKFKNGSSFIFKTEAIGAGGYNIQQYHLRYLTHFTDIILADGTKASNRIGIVENFSEQEEEPDEIINPFDEIRYAKSEDEIAKIVYNCIKSGGTRFKSAKDIKKTKGSDGILVEFNPNEFGKVNHVELILDFEKSLEENASQAEKFLGMVGGGRYKSKKMAGGGDVNGNSFTVKFSRATEFGSVINLYNGIEQKLSSSHIKFNSDKSQISFDYSTDIFRFVDDVRYIINKDAGTPIHFTQHRPELKIDYQIISGNPSKEDIIYAFESLFEMVLDKKEIEYEEGYEDYDPSVEYWIVEKNKMAGGGEAKSMSIKELLKHLYKEHHDSFAIAKDLEETTPITGEMNAERVIEMWDKELDDHFREEEERIFPRLVSMNITLIPDVDYLIATHNKFRNDIIPKVRSDRDRASVIRFASAIKEHILDEEKLFRSIMPDPYQEITPEEMERGGSAGVKKKSNSPLLAPNGKKSNLTPEQYKLVRTKAFKAWFGDWENDPKNASKVVDENGEPLVVYHGTENIFYEFDKSHSREGMYGKGFYFTQYEKMASAYGKPMGVFLSIKKSVRVTPKKTPDVLSKIISSDARYLYGYDGVIVYDGENKLQSITVFSSNQIKLADGSNTTFDPNNPDIRYEKGGVADSESFKEWFDGSKVVNENGSPLIVYHGTDKKRPFAGEVRGDIGIHFGTRKASEDRLESLGIDNGNISAYYLSIKNPLRIRDVGAWADFKDVANELLKVGIISESEYASAQEIANVEGLRGKEHRGTIDILKGKGYDGFVYKNDSEDIGSDSYIVLDTSQIREVNFDREHSDIGRRKGGKAKSELKGRIQPSMLGATLNPDLKDKDSVFSNGGKVLLAQNGKSSSLNEVQWNLVRGHNFRIWFGDWINQGFVNKVLSSRDFVEIIPDSERVGWKEENKLAKKFPRRDMVISKKIRVYVGKNFYEHTIRHAIRDEVYFSIFFIEEICNESMLFDVEKNTKPEDKPNIDFYECYLCPIIFNGEEFIARLTVGVEIGGARILYDMNVVKKETIKRTMKDKLSSRTVDGSEHHEDALLYKDRKFTLLIKTFSKNISKVRDENGEPLVLWHGTHSKFNEFLTPSYFSDQKEASDYGEIKPYFLNIKRPYFKHKSEPYIQVDFLTGSIKDINAPEIMLYDYDGISNLKSSDSRYVVAFHPNQIKLADGSNKAFDGNNPDVRYGAGGEVNESNYFQNTKGEFEIINKKEYDSVDVEEFVSEFGSRYKVEGGVLYRGADHWGEMKIVRWNLKNKEYVGDSFEGELDAGLDGYDKPIYAKILLRSLSPYKEAVVDEDGLVKVWVSMTANNPSRAGITPFIEVHPSLSIDDVKNVVTGKYPDYAYFKYRGARHA